MKEMYGDNALADFMAVFGEDIATGKAGARIDTVGKNMVAAFVKPLEIAQDFYDQPADRMIQQIRTMPAEMFLAFGEFATLRPDEDPARKDLDRILQLAGLPNTKEIGQLLIEVKQRVDAGDDKGAAALIGRFAGNLEFQQAMSAFQGIAHGHIATIVQEFKPPPMSELPAGKGYADVVYGPQGERLTIDDVVRTGISPERAQALINEARATNSVIVIKPGAEEAIVWRDRGAISKGTEFAAKSGNELDQYIGLGSSKDQGLVLYGEPHAPEKPSGMSNRDWNDIRGAAQERYLERQAEYLHNYQTMQDYRTKGLDLMVEGQVQHVTIDWRDGGTLIQGGARDLQFHGFGDHVVYAMTSDGRRIPIAGDVDIFTHQGSIPLSEAMPGLQRAEPGIAHMADTPNWHPTEQSKINTRDKILNDFSALNENGENLVVIGPDTMTTGRYDPATRVVVTFPKKD
jgi:hypothetical protein